MTRLRQEWKVALVALVLIAIGFAVGLYLIRNVDTDLGLTPTTTEASP